MPGAARVQQDIGDTVHGDRHVKAEIFIAAEFAFGKRAVQGGIQQGARCADRHPRAGAIGAAGPAGVDQPAGGTVVMDLFLQQLAINLGSARHEGRAEAGAECRFGLGHATLGARHLGGEARQEVIHGLRRGQPGNGRQNAERIAGQHDDMLGMPPQRGFRRVGNGVQRIGHAGVVGQRIVVEIQFQSFGVEHHVFND